MSDPVLQALSFHQRSSLALKTPQIRRNFRRAMDGLMQKRAAVFPDQEELQTLRELAKSIRNRALAKLPDLLEQLEANLIRNGIQVHWAQTPEEACEMILSICQQYDAKSVIKGKSMVSEEIDLNHFLAKAGIEALESDLGEYIVQLAEETPSHIIMPAIHKNTEEIAQLLHTKTAIENKPDAEYLTQQARNQLRERFRTADVGISGVNFAVAETGTLCLVENEGNGRLTTSVPPVHIAVTGIEKVIEKFEDLAPLYSLLPRSATGQIVTTYLNLISRPRQAHEKDGPTAVHLVLVDNGRSTIYQDDQLAETLRCIRCGACMNHCPVYTRIGGHAYGHTYPGPIGKILMPHLIGLEATKDLPTASTLCGACAEVCPVKIPIPELLVRLREEVVAGNSVVKQFSPEGEISNQARIQLADRGIKKKFVESMLFKGWRWMNTHPKLYRVMTFVLSRFRNLQPKQLSPWTDYRTLPKIAPKSLHEMMKAKSKK